MGVLESMRSGSDSTFMQVVLALVVISFVMMSANLQGDTANVVAVVNGVKIMDTDLNKRYRQEIQARGGGTLSDAQQAQLVETVKQLLIRDEVLLQEATRMGLEVSSEETLQRKYMMFRNEQGKFDPDGERRMLKRSRITQADFDQTLREDLLREKLTLLVYTGASLSEPALREAYIEDETRIELDTVRVPHFAFEKKVEISDADRTAWLAENETLVKETYDRDFDRRYNHPEKIEVSMIRLVVYPDGPNAGDLLPKLQTLREEIEAGADFAALAKRWSEDASAAKGGNTGIRPLAQLQLEEQNAVKDLTAGQLTAVFTTANDVRLYRVEQRIEPKVDTLDEVKNSIADELLKSEKTPVMALTFAEEELLVKWAESGTVPQSMLDEYGLSVHSTGPISAKPNPSPMSPPAEMLADAQNAKPGEVLPSVYEHYGTPWVGKLSRRIDADLELFEAKKESLREGMLQRQRNDFLMAWIDHLQSQATIQ